MYTIGNLASLVNSDRPVVYTQYSVAFLTTVHLTEKMMAELKGFNIPFSAAGATDHIFLRPGDWVITIDYGGSTVELQVKHRDQDPSKFQSVEFPDETTSTSTHEPFRVPGGLDYRLNVTSFVGAGQLFASAAAKN